MKRVDKVEYYCNCPYPYFCYTDQRDVQNAPLADAAVSHVLNRTTSRDTSRKVQNGADAKTANVVQLMSSSSASSSSSSSSFCRCSVCQSHFIIGRLTCCILAYFCIFNCCTVL